MGQYYRRKLRIYELETYKKLKSLQDDTQFDTQKKSNYTNYSTKKVQNIA